MWKISEESVDWVSDNSHKKFHKSELKMDFGGLGYIVTDPRSIPVQAHYGLSTASLILKSHVNMSVSLNVFIITPYNVQRGHIK